MSLDPTLKAIKSASERNAQLLFTHHPLIFSPLSHIDIHAYPGKVIAKAIKSNISIVAAHTNLDVAQGGINDIMADLLGLQCVEVLNKIDGDGGAGLGRVGNLPEPRILSSVVDDIGRIFGNKRHRLVAQGDSEIHRIAVVGGSGGNQIPTAAQKGADLLVTGDVGHHHALEAESLGMALMDAGHFNTESTAFKVFAERLQAMANDLDWEVEVEWDENEINPLEN